MCLQSAVAALFYILCCVALAHLICDIRSSLIISLLKYELLTINKNLAIKFWFIKLLQNFAEDFCSFCLDCFQFIV